MQIPPCFLTKSDATMSSSSTDVSLFAGSSTTSMRSRRSAVSRLKTSSTTRALGNEAAREEKAGDAGAPYKRVPPYEVYVWSME